MSLLFNKKNYANNNLSSHRYEQEQRLHSLKHQEHKPLQTSSEQKKLQHLRDTVEKQEAQLKMVRALKGQVEQKRLSNGKLGEHHSAAHYEL